MSNDSCDSCQNPSVTTDCTIDAVIAKAPNALAILGEHNIDTCCGGRATLGEAAAHAHVDSAALVTLLNTRARACGCG